MKKTLKTFILFIFVLSAAFIFAENGARVYEEAGGFSFCPPLDWKVMQFPGLKYKVAIGPVDDNFQVNINFVDEDFSGGLEAYVDANLSAMENYFEEYKLLGRKSFTSDEGILGETVAINNRQQKFLLKQIFYFFPKPGGGYFVITCSATEASSERYLSIFDESIKTFLYAASAAN